MSDDDFDFESLDEIIPGDEAVKDNGVKTPPASLAGWKEAACNWSEGSAELGAAAFHCSGVAKQVGANFSIVCLDIM